MEFRIPEKNKKSKGGINIAHLLILFCAFAFAIQAFALDVSVVDYGAVPDDANEDTVAVQAAADAVYAAGGGTVGFPSGTYILKIVNIKPAAVSETVFTTLGNGTDAVIKLRNATAAELNDPTYPHKWNRIFTTDGVAYNGITNSNPLSFRKLTFDMNRQNQGAYDEYQLEHQAAIFLSATASSPGKVVGIVEDCYFHDSAADSISAHINVSLQVRRCQAMDSFRGGLTITGGNTDVLVDNFMAGGDVHKTGIDIEVDATGYGGSLAIDATMQHMYLRGDFDIGLGIGSTFIGDDITVDESPFLIGAKNSSVDISDSTFYVGSNDDGSGNYLYFAKNVTFRDCTFTAKKNPGDNGTSFSPIYVIFKPTDSEGHDQTATFDHCTWTIGTGVTTSDSTYAIRVTQDKASNNNHLNIVDCTIGAGYDYGVYLDRGGKIFLQNTDIDATTGIRLKRDTTGFDYDITVDGVTFGSNTVTTEEIYNSGWNSRITHHNMLYESTGNTLSTTSGLVQNDYFGGRRIIGSEIPGTSTPGLKGDLYQIDPLPALGNAYQWICTNSHQTGATWAEYQFVPAADSNLIGHWKYDEENGTVARDSSGNSHDGTLTNGPVRTTGRSWLWRSLSMDGYNDYVSIGGDENFFDFATGHDFTLSAWIKWDGTNQSWQPVIQKGNLNSNNYYFLGVKDTGIISFRLKDGANVYAGLNAGYATANEWIHIAGTKDGQHIRIYVNGTEISSAVHGFTAGFSSAYPLRLGFLSYLTPPAYLNYGFHGDMDDVRVYNRALGPSEILDVYSRAPEVIDDYCVTTENASLVIDVLANDFDNSHMSVASVTQPSHGIASVNPDNTVTYTPSSGYNGNDSFNYTVSNECCRTMAATVSVTIYSPDSDPTTLAYWTLDETNGIIAADNSGYGHDGTLVNGPVWTGNGLSVDGYDDYVDAGDENAFDFVAGQNFTLAAWIKWDGTNQTWQPVIQKGNLNSNNYYFLGIKDTGGIYFKLKDGAGVSGDAYGGTAPVNTWIHVTCVKNGQRIRIYVNGTEVSSVVHGFTSGFSSVYPMRLGFLSYITPPTYLNSGFHGIIDEVRIYDRALSTEEIQLLASE